MMDINKLGDLIHSLATFECPECSGSGEVDDAEMGDISFNTSPCPACKGNGIKDGKKLKLEEQ